LLQNQHQDLGDCAVVLRRIQMIRRSPERLSPLAVKDRDR
jgi:hypothetical protein